MQDYTPGQSPIDDLKTRIKVKRGIFARDWVDVKTYEFDTNHCIIKTDEIYEINSNITLSFHMPLAIDDIVIEDYVGKIRKKKKDCSCFHYFIDFTEGKSSEGQIAENKIKQIANLIKKKKTIEAKKQNVSQRNA